MAYIKKKAAPKKRKYTKRTNITPVVPPSNMTSVVKFALDRMSIKEKADIFAHILGRNEPLDEKQLWAVQKLLSN